MYGNHSVRVKAIVWLISNHWKPDLKILQAEDIFCIVTPPSHNAPFTLVFSIKKRLTTDLFVVIKMPSHNVFTVRDITCTSYVQLPGRKYFVENEDVKSAALR